MFMVLAEISTIPEKPGCYQFFDAERCLYVGKAVNLRQRLASYLTDAGPAEPRVADMVKKATRLEWVVLSSEQDALIAEASMIAELDPVYNIKLREDHPYPSVAIDKRDAVAKISTWRGPAKKGVEVYGPYPGSAARHIVESLVIATKMRSCDSGKFRMHQRLQRPCLLAEVGRCSAPCVSTEGYENVESDARSVLRGRTAKLIEAFEDEMGVASRETRYEVAAKYRDRAEAVRRINSAQDLLDAGGRSLDIVGVHLDGIGGAACVIAVREGRIVRTRFYVMDGGIATEDALLEAARASGCAGTVPVMDAGRDARDERLLRLARENAKEALGRARMLRASTMDARRSEISQLQKTLGLTRAPLRIESVDISHLGGAATVSVVALLVDGMPVRNRYRKYRLKDHGGDDYAAMREVVTRRIADSLDGKAPYMDLLLIDGGRNQLAVAVEVLEELGVRDKVEVVSLAKRLEEVFVPGHEESVVLDRGDAALLLLQRARDETHAASNKFQQQVASRMLRKDYLDGVAGLGSARKKLVLGRLGGWRGLETAEREELDAITEIPAAVRERIWLVLEGRRGNPNTG